MHITTYCNCHRLGFRCGVIALKNIEICSLSVAKWLSIQFETVLIFVTGWWAMSTRLPVPAILLSLTAVDILSAHHNITNTSTSQPSEYTNVLNLETIHGVACIYTYISMKMESYGYLKKNIYIYMYICKFVYMYICIYVYMYIYIYNFLTYFYHQPPISTVDRCWNLHVFQVAESSAVHGTSTQRGFSSFPIQTITTLMRLFKKSNSW